MKRHNKRLNRIAHVSFFRIFLLSVAANIIFFPSFTPYVKTGNNMYDVYLDGNYVGTTDKKDTIDSYLRDARLRVAKESSSLILLDPELELRGKEVVYGSADSRKTIIENMQTVLLNEAEVALQHSYTVKINTYVVNLQNSDEVEQLLQAAVDSYDTSQSFDVELITDTSRELNVLTASITKKEQEKKVEKGVLQKAGMSDTIDSIFKEIEPERELDFEDYEQGILDINFKDNIEIVEAYLPSSQLTPLETAIEQVTKEQEVPSVYEVQSGDTLGGITLKLNLTMDQLIAMNDSLENENSVIRVGQELIITVPKPELSVNWKEQKYEEQNYKAEVQYVYNDEWYTNQTQTLQDPIDGHRKVMEVISYTNNDVTNIEILKEEVTMEAVPKIVEKGTKIPPTFIKPISGGRLSSRFGSRSAPTKGASTYHKGVDWAVPIGTSVVASCGGKVTQAGWANGYGYCIYITHEGGRQTRYGHLSKVLVHAGQYVNQGDRIALSGNSGRSTGPHLHFEIRINGTAVDPLKIINQ